MAINYPGSVDEFKAQVGKFQDSDRYKSPLLFAVGGEVITKSQGILASVRYPLVNGPQENEGSAAIIMEHLDIAPEGVQDINMTVEQINAILRSFSPFENDGKTHKNIDVLKAAKNTVTKGNPVVASFIFDDIDPVSVEDSTLKLYGISTRKFKPNSLNLNKIFTKLPNVAWVGDTPMDEDEVNAALMSAAFDEGEFAPHMVDKFPLYTHRINAQEMGVRITDQNKVRLGAYLSKGTTLMPGASYINFNAGTLGGAMVEGRVSSSATVGEGTDVGGGASMLGTLSGGNETPISTGKNCLLEVNSCLGIPIGDAVIIGAETAILAGTKVKIDIEGHKDNGKTVKASELAGINAVTFRRNSQSGAIEVVRTNRNLEFVQKLKDGSDILNADLHGHN